MHQQLKVLQDEGVISEMETRDAKDDDNTQIADIDYFINEGNCDAFVISPNSTAAMTPAVERACETGKPVIVFDRGVQTDCPTTFIHPIGGYAWGIDTANFLSREPRGRATRWSRCASCPASTCWRPAGRRPRRSSRRRASRPRTTSPAPTPPKIKKIISDALAKGDVKGVWMDAGDGAVAAIEAFEDAGVDLPIMTGEDEMSFLRKWEETGLTGLAPVYSNFQWRTPLLAVAEDLRRRGGPHGMGAAAGADHRGRAGRVPRGERRHARRALRQVRRRGPARLPGGLAGPRQIP